MHWRIKKINENEEYIFVGYNSGGGDSFDGMILFDKAAKEAKVIMLASNSDEFDGKWCAAHVRNKILDGALLSDKPVTIALG